MTTYEWDIETMEGDEIADHNHSDHVPSKPLSENQVLTLVRDGGDGRRSWAYVKDGIISPVFSDAYENPVCDVPKRFLREFSKSIHSK